MAFIEVSTEYFLKCYLALKVFQKTIDVREEQLILFEMLVTQTSVGTLLAQLVLGG